MLLRCNGALGPCCNEARGSGCSGAVDFREAHSRGCHSSSTRSFDILGICLLGRRGLPWSENHCCEPQAAACHLRQVGTETSSPFSQQCHWGVTTWQHHPLSPTSVGRRECPLGRAAATDPPLPTVFLSWGLSVSCHIAPAAVLQVRSASEQTHHLSEKSKQETDGPHGHFVQLPVF